MAESKGDGRCWTYERHLCCACSETQETSRCWCERTGKVMNQQMKKMLLWEGKLLTWNILDIKYM